MTKHVIKTHSCPYKAVRKHEGIGQFVVYDSQGKYVRKVLTKTGNETKVEQHHRTEIKKMVERAEANGLFRASVKFEGEMDDFPDYNFQEAQFMMAKAKSMFESLPSRARAEFDNNPAKFMDFANNPQNANKMVEMGLAKGLDNLTADGKPTREKSNVDNNQGNNKGVSNEASAGENNKTSK